jgi:hypothetical protein
MAVQLDVVIIAGMLSIMFHFCKLVDGTVCLHGLSDERLQDHIGSESILLSMACLFAPFKYNWQRTVFFLLIVFGLFEFKQQSDTLWYTMVLGVPLFLSGARPYLWYREMHLSAISGVIALTCYYNEPEVDGQLLHSLWHLFIFTSVILANMARFTHRCSKDCQCELRVRTVFWTITYRELFVYFFMSITCRRSKINGYHETTIVQVQGAVGYGRTPPAPAKLSKPQSLVESSIHYNLDYRDQMSASNQKRVKPEITWMGIH